MAENNHTLPADGWTTVIRPKTGWFDIDLHELWQYRDLIVMFVKRNFTVLYLSLIHISSEAAAEETTDEAAGEVTTVNAGKLTMSTNAAFPPYEMTTDSGDLEGIDIEVAGAIAEKLGLELQVDDMDFDAALLATQSGKSDMVMAGVTVTDERQKVMDLSLIHI